MDNNYNTEAAMDTDAKAIYQDESGLCEYGTVILDDEGIPVTAYGYEYTRKGETVLKGWGELSGTAEVWEHVGGAYSVLINRAAI